MTQIIKNRAIVSDPYVFVEDGAPLPASEHVFVSFARYLAEKDALLASGKKLGIRLPSDKLPKDIPDLHRLALIAIEFPRFTDGRGYSIARLLRDREKYRGEVRAVGWVLRDNLLYMERSGFDAFALLPGKPLESGLEAFKELPLAYQANAVDPRPLYRRRA
jgi:uncharacterized protein (DUF934 family)